MEKNLGGTSNGSSRLRTYTAPPDVSDPKVVTLFPYVKAKKEIIYETTNKDHVKIDGCVTMHN